MVKTGIEVLPDAGDVAAVSGSGDVVDLSGAGPISVFDADFQRDAQDLVILEDQTPVLRITGYFDHLDTPDLIAENGAVLRGDTVKKLAGAALDNVFAQSSDPEGVVPIGQVERIAGSASVQRTDGTSETLTVGVKIYQNDVLSTEADGTLSVTFSDGTIFALSPSSRMVIDELVYETGGADNSAAFNLVTGGFVFIAGQVAKTGDMDVSTPSATMGIRGTTVQVDLQVVDGIVRSIVALNRDPDGGIGSIELFDLNGELITTITTTDTQWQVSPEEGQTFEIPRTEADQAEDSVLIAEAVAAYQSAYARVAGGSTFVELGDGSGSGPNNNPVPDGGEPELQLEPGADRELGPVDRFDGQTNPGEPGGQQPGNGPQNGPQDGGGGSLDESGIDNIRGVPGSPEAQNIRVAGLEDTALGIQGQAFVSGGTSGNLVFSISSQPSNGSATMSTDGAFTYVPNLNFSGSDSFVYQVQNSDGTTDTGTVLVNVAGVNDLPLVSSPAVSTDEDAAVTGQISATDADGDTVTFSLSTGAANGSVVLLANGTFAYTPDPDFEGLDSFTYVASDGAGGQQTGTVDVTVRSVDDIPVIDFQGSVLTAAIPAPGPTAGGTGSASGAGRIEADGTVNFFDPDDGETFSGGFTARTPKLNIGTFALSNLVPGTVAGSFAFVWTFDVGQGAFDGLAAGDTRVQIYDVTIADSSGFRTSVPVKVTILGENDKPVARSDLATTDEDSAVTIAVLNNDSDVDGDGLKVTTATADHGTVEIRADGRLVYRPDADFNGTDNISYALSDGKGGTSAADVSVTVNAVNDKPVARPEATVTEQDTSVTIAVLSNDSDVDGDVLSVSNLTHGNNGTTQLNPDGTVTYTPNADFFGVDFFTYQSDDGTESTETTVNVIVEQDQSSFPDDLPVSLSFNVDTTGDAPAGSVQIGVTPVDATAINLSIALDRSGSITAAGWQFEVNAVADALEDLADQFRGSQTEFDVQIISYASGVTVLPTADLYSTLIMENGVLVDPATQALADAVRALPFNGGSTNWEDALRASETFFDQQPTDEVNILYFATDGYPFPSSQDWQDALDSLNAGVPLTGTGTYVVDIEAFGIGNSVNFSLLNLVDSDGDATRVEGPADLVDAFTQSPLFNAQLADFSLRLISDGTDRGEIADENSPAFTSSGLEFRLSLAEIDGLSSLLGSNNTLSAVATFDLDGDLSTVSDRIDLFAAASFGEENTPQNKAGSAGSDLLLGGGGNDTISGLGGNDVILGFGGHDNLIGGDGDDLLSVEAFSAGRLDGGAGRDILSILLGGSIASPELAALSIADIEALDLTNNEANSLTLTKADVFGLSSTPDIELEALLGPLPGNEAVSVYGDTSDSVTLSGDATAEFVRDAPAGTVTDSAGNDLDVFRLVDAGSGDVLATLGIDTDVAVTVTTA